MAITGLVLGYLGIAVIPLKLIIAAIAIPNLLRARIAANEASAVATLRSINSAQVAYQATYPAVGFARDLPSLGGAEPCARPLACSKTGLQLPRRPLVCTATLSAWSLQRMARSTL